MIPFFPVRFPILNDKINYRNHRKIVIIDGNEGFVGGLNIGDEYLGKDKYFGFWRDTHLYLRGKLCKVAAYFPSRLVLYDWRGCASPEYYKRKQLRGALGRRAARCRW